MDKIKVSRKVVEYIDLECSTLGDIQKKIENYIETYGEDATLESYYEYSETPYYGIFVSELESDAEYSYRIAVLERKKEYERQQYEKLKAKFDS